MLRADSLIVFREYLAASRPRSAAATAADPRSPGKASRSTSTPGPGSPYRGLGWSCSLIGPREALSPVTMSRAPPRWT